MLWFLDVNAQYAIFLIELVIRSAPEFRIVFGDFFVRRKLNRRPHGDVPGGSD
jgi:hypothetical protein